MSGLGWWSENVKLVGFQTFICLKVMTTVSPFHMLLFGVICTWHTPNYIWSHAKCNGLSHDWPVGEETWRSKTLAELIHWLKTPRGLLGRRRNLSKLTTINGEWKSWKTSYRTILTHSDRSSTVGLLYVVAGWEYQSTKQWDLPRLLCLRLLENSVMV